MEIEFPNPGFAAIVDINGYTRMVSDSAERIDASYMATFVRDVLAGSIEAVEDNGGLVVGFMGDAFLAILPNAESTVMACIAIAADVRKQCEYFADGHHDNKEWLPWAVGGISLKIGVEFGVLSKSVIRSKFLGDQTLFVGEAINHAARILSAGHGNRCLFGPRAVAAGVGSYELEGPLSVNGKPGEPDYQYYTFDLSEQFEPR